MKHLLLTTIAAVLLTTTAFADPIHDAAAKGDLAGVQAELDKGVDVNTKGGDAGVPPFAFGRFKWSHGSRRTTHCQRCGFGRNG